MAAIVTVITIGGASRPLFYGIRDAIAAEQRMGHSIRVALAETSFQDLVVLLWAGLRGRDPKLTTDTVAGWLDQARQGESAAMIWWDTVAEGLMASGLVPRTTTSTPPAEGDGGPPTEPWLPHGTQPGG